VLLWILKTSDSMLLPLVRKSLAAQNWVVLDSSLFVCSSSFEVHDLFQSGWKRIG
jgi:hypothetical protein